jgi:hypothetical protein
MLALFSLLNPLGLSVKKRFFRFPRWGNKKIFGARKLTNLNQLFGDCEHIYKSTLWQLQAYFNKIFVSLEHSLIKK